ncbi:TPA: type I methionyl aminopeptidase [bacterium]|nr:type I methionyl aminopeptidase [bacterium]
MIVLKSNHEVNLIHENGRLAAKVLATLGKLIKPGVTTKELEDVAHRLITKENGYPAFLNYKGFPASICTSINEVVVHGIPDNRCFKEGDIISIDIGVFRNACYADIAATFAVGRISKKAERLLKVAKEALYEGIRKARPPNRVFDISWAIQSLVEKKGFNVVRSLTGHGIGQELHEEPQVPNFGEPGKGARLKPGMVLCIEPMINEGGFETTCLDDGWTIVTKDGSLSAHFEHTVLITETNAKILTKL